MNWRSRFQGKVCRMAKNGKAFSHFWWNLPNLSIQIMSPFVRLPVRASTDGTSNDSPLGIICSVASVKGSKWSKSRNFYRISTFSKGYLDIEKIWWYLNMQKSRSQTEEAEVEAVGYAFQGRKFSNLCHKKIWETSSPPERLSSNLDVLYKAVRS